MQIHVGTDISFLDHCGFEMRGIVEDIIVDFKTSEARVIVFCGTHCDDYPITYEVSPRLIQAIYTPTGEWKRDYAPVKEVR